MQRLTSIVAVNHEGVIGCGNTLPWRLKSDLRFFKERTIDNVIIMGRRTFDSLGRKCLPNRFNIVLSHSFGMFPDTDLCKPAAGIAEGLAVAEHAPRRFKDGFIIGGASMYQQFAPFVDRYLVTLVDKTVSNGDTFFNQSVFNNEDEWEMKTLFSSPADPPNDEVSFQVFEICARNPQVIQERRRHVTEDFNSQRSVRFTPKRSVGGHRRSANDDSDLAVML